MKVRSPSSSIPKKRSETAALKIKKARIEDAASLAELSGQLGYRTTAREMRGRLRRIRPAAQNAILVAEFAGKLIGWLHVSVNPLLEVPLRAEVNALIVDENHRGSGAGARLLAAAEIWARSKGCRNMSVRSNVVRDRAHKFYLRQGYQHYKTQKAFRKDL
jgi:GNAT superfamily N-acetyltransferase